MALGPIRNKINRCDPCAIRHDYGASDDTFWAIVLCQQL